jgi:Na+/melibiose symporter-like transporter
MPWYIAGFVLASISILPLFVNLQAEEGYQYLYYLTFSFTYNISWAAIQVSHMSLVPSLTPSRERRVPLPLLRTASTTSGPPSPTSPASWCSASALCSSSFWTTPPFSFYW